MELLWPASLTPLGSGSALQERGLHVPNPYPQTNQHPAQQLFHDCCLLNTHCLVLTLLKVLTRQRHNV
ncbi:hypothetical protein CesoFtcFv8_020695 [Champsocephalus esox]|uniref:Uncharacterized protein n=1 Tax=Champsocephalus esox TaxID=159716 RepID=A0AAN8GLU6_9TELE|nr:hypothetical protein CesoFtcFv8_020695 [Champsocephalus esox]